MKRLLLSFSALMMAVAMFAQPINPSHPNLTGLWEFNAPSDLTHPTTGQRVGVAYGSPTQMGNGITAIQGTSATDGAVSIPTGTHFRANPNFSGPNGGGTFVNEYTLVMDIKAPAIGNWMSFYQTSATNSNDGELFIRPSGAMGVGAVGYTATPVITANTWHRVTIAVDLGTSFKYYVDGSLIYTGTSQSVDGRFASYEDLMFLFADDNGDDDTLDVTSVAIYETTLTDADVLALGNTTTAINPSSTGLVGLWEFDTYDINYPTVGMPLVVASGNPSADVAGAITPIAGAYMGDSAVTIPLGTHLKVDPNTTPNGGSATYINEYTYVADVKLPSLGSWYSFFQTNNTNTNDGEVFINPSGNMGVGAVGYTSTAAVTANTWHRVAVSVDLGTSFKYYIDGNLIYTGTSQAIDGRFALYEDLILLFADENGDDATIDVSMAAMFDVALTDAEVAALGNATVSNNLVEGIGAGATLDFDGTNDWLDASGNAGNKVSAASLGLPDTSITLEAWVNPAVFQTWDGIVGFLQDNGSTEAGWDLELRGGNKFAFTLASQGNGSLTYLETVSTYSTNEWHHIAGVYDGTNMRIYVDGILENVSTAQSGAIDYLDSWLAIGTYRDDNENNKFQGNIDEVRIWNVARSEAQIRDMMCQKLNGNEAGLVAYYRMDENQGNVVKDHAGTNDADFVGFAATDWMASGAALGDSSIHTYTAASLTFATPNHGTITGDNPSLPTLGGHAYFVDAAPVDTTNIIALGGVDGYFGSFAVGAGASFDITYNYAAFPAAVAIENTSDVFERDNAAMAWMIPGATKDVANKEFYWASTNQRGEYIIAEASAFCDTSDNFMVTNAAVNFVDLDWNSSASNWIIEYGVHGFTQGTGTIDTISSSNLTVTGLTAGTTYDIYIQDSCANVGTSAVAGPFHFSTLNVIANNNVGAGNNIQFDGANDWVDASGGAGNKVSATSLNLPTQDITLEAWVKPSVYQTWDAVVGFLQDNGSTEAGWDLELRGGNKFAFTLASTGNGSLTYLETTNSFNTDEWYHIAGTYDGDTMKVYVNGILENTSTAQSGAIDYLDSWLAIGTYRDDNENNKLQGNIDEVRIWNVARSEAQIRNMMCQKLTGTETGLVSYYRMDEGQGSTVADVTMNAHGTTIGIDTVNDWRTSGAALGDVSAYTYPAAWMGASVSLASANGTFMVDSVMGTADGIHIYQVNSIPNTFNGITIAGNNNTYFGSFVTGDATTTFDANYDYAIYPLAVQSESNLKIFNRMNNADMMWMDLGATVDTLANVIAKNGVTGIANEYMLANFTAYACQDPTALIVTGTTFNSATLAWSGGGSNVWNIEYGPTGFTQGTGTTIQVTANPYVVTGLMDNTAYDFYVQDDCGTQGTSNWFGPVAASTTIAPPCNTPTNLSASASFSTATLSWTTGGSSVWNIEYGPAGFTQGTGTVIYNVTTNPYVLSNLMSQTDYDFYVQDTCNQVNASSWAGPASFTTLYDYTGIGAGMAVDIADQDWIDCSNNNGNKVSAASLGLPVTAITLEAWVKPHTYSIWHSVIAFMQDNGSFERGFDLETRGGNKFAFAIKSTGASSLTYLETANSFDVEKWYHLAGVYDGDTMKFYINGVLEATSTAQSGDLDYADSWLSLGSYKDDNEDFPIDAAIDEIRIWDHARSLDDIRNMMCQKLHGNEAGLVSYWKLDEGTGTMVMDLAGNNNGTFRSGLNPVSSWEVSGAALGDTSTYLYANDYAGLSLDLSSADRGNMVLDSMAGGMLGMHLYQVNSTPNFDNGIADIADQNVYYGAFAAPNPTGAPFDYNATYDYSNYPNAVANEANLQLYNRSTPAFTTWANSGATVDVANDEVAIANVGTRREFLLADFSANPCAPSSALGATNVTTTTADLTWTAGGATSFNVEYGPAGFVLGTGATLTGVTSPVTISGLTNSTSYDFYVEDVCAATGGSTFIGPFTFTTINPCPAPTAFTVNVISDTEAQFNVTTTGTNNDWTVQWGPSGFTFGNGILTNASGNPFVLNVFQGGGTYDVYIQADCDSLDSPFIGPITFEMFATGTQAAFDSKSVTVYPNPNNGQFVVETQLSEPTVEITVTNVVGAVVWTQPNAIGTAKHYISLENEAAGIYFVRVRLANGELVTKKVLID